MKKTKTKINILSEDNTYIQKHTYIFGKNERMQGRRKSPVAELLAEPPIPSAPLSKEVGKTKKERKLETISNLGVVSLWNQCLSFNKIKALAKYKPN